MATPEPIMKGRRSAKVGKVGKETETLPLFGDPEPVETEVIKPVPAKDRGGKATRKKGMPNAQDMALRQREISISEFFTKNRHLLGFDNPSRALLATVKEAVDNSLDACEEAGIPPDIEIDVEEVSDGRYKVAVQDNGPGIVKSQIPKIFGRLLYGSKFHALKQTRGQQGIGISAAGMYGQLTTGKPVITLSRTGPTRPAHYYEIRIDNQRNRPIIVKEGDVEWEGVDSGTRVEIELEGRYQRGRHSVDEYLRLTGIANPHVKILYHAPNGETTEMPRVAEGLPAEPKEIKPHPYGVELGLLSNMLKEAKGVAVNSLLTGSFSRVSDKVAAEITGKASISGDSKCHLLKPDQVESIFRAISETKIMAPPVNCLSPIGDELIRSSLADAINADFYVSVTRPPSVYRGNPFLVEAGIAYGGDLPADELVSLGRFANRVPLLYQQSACAISTALLSIDWRSYGLQQAKGALPTGPAMIMVHLASVWVPFTSESKEAIADYDEITRQIRLALQECGRKLGRFVKKRKREAEAARKQGYISKYIPHIGIALKEILDLKDKEVEDLTVTLAEVLERSRK